MRRASRWPYRLSCWPWAQRAVHAQQSSHDLLRHQRRQRQWRRSRRSGGRRCALQALAEAAGSKLTNWSLSEHDSPGGCWRRRARPHRQGAVAQRQGRRDRHDVDDLHSDEQDQQADGAHEKGEASAAAATRNVHDILTGSDPHGTYSTAGGDTTCGNWTKSGDGSAIVGHHDRVGLKDTRHMTSWNSSHGSRGSARTAQGSGGGGLSTASAN